jgi:hypothetical protein
MGRKRTAKLSAPRKAEMVKFAMRFSTERGVVGDDMAKCKAQRDAAKASRKKE